MAQAEKKIGTGEGTKRPQRLLYLLKRLYSASRARLDEIARAHDLTAGDYTMLSFLKRLEPCSAAALSREQRITPQAATQQVAQLKAKGMVTAQENEANRRISLISMTDLGRTSLAAISAEARKLEAEMTADFTDAERAALIALLSRSIDTLVDEEQAEDGE